MKLLFVVHRYAPFPGGSEIYVQNMAEESARRGHDVTVFAGEHKGNYNGIPVTSDQQILMQQWDLIIVHGGDVNVQNFVLSNAPSIPSPILYLLILPSNSRVCVTALHDVAFIGCSTNQDWDHCKNNNVTDKAVTIRHGINWETCLGKPGFKEKHNIKKRMFLSCGGYWPNKAMKELAHIFSVANLDDAVLVTTGYDNRMDLMPTKTNSVIPLMINDRDEVLSAMYDADCVLMHSYQEGFGLVLLESMLNQTPWIARNIAGAEFMKQYGKTYESDAELLTHITQFNRSDFNVESSYNYLINNHLISNTIDDIESIVKSNA